MYLLFIGILLAAIQNKSYSQTETMLSLYAAPAITYTYSPSGLPSPKSAFSPQYGMSIIHFITPNISLESGVSYQNKSALYMKDNMDTRKAIIDLNGNGIPDPEDRLDLSLVVPTDYSNKYSIISLPLIVNYLMGNLNETSFIGSAGINFNFIYNVEVVSKSDKFGENSESQLSTSYFASSFLAGFAINQPLSDKINLVTGPKYYLDFYTAEKLKARFHTIGLEIKITYSL